MDAKIIRGMRISKIIIVFGESELRPCIKSESSFMTAPVSISIEPKRTAIIMLAIRNSVKSNARAYKFLLFIVRK